jgi:hypothetical protein
MSRNVILVTHLSYHFLAWRIGEIHVGPMLCERCQSAEVDLFSSSVEKSGACAALVFPEVVQQEWTEIYNCQLPAPLPLTLWFGVVAGVSLAIMIVAVVLIAAVLAVVVLIDTGLSRDNDSAAIIRMLHLHLPCRPLHRTEEQLSLELRRVLHDGPESHVDSSCHNEVEDREMRQDGFNELMRKIQVIARDRAAWFGYWSFSASFLWKVDENSESPKSPEESLHIAAIDWTFSDDARHFVWVGLFRLLLGNA